MALPLPLVIDWRARAACRDADPEIFFPVGDPDDPADERNLDALSYCARCPVVAECLAFALAKIPYGIAGGMTAAQRRELRAAALPRTPSPVRSPLAPSPYRVGPKTHVRTRGIALLVEKRLSIREVADRLEVDVRTVQRWAARPEVAPLLPAADPSPPPGISRREARAMGARRVS